MAYLKQYEFSNAVLHFIHLKEERGMDAGSTLPSSLCDTFHQIESSTLNTNNSKCRACWGVLRNDEDDGGPRDRDLRLSYALLIKGIQMKGYWFNTCRAG
jgi:hypothetical protein